MILACDVRRLRPTDRKCGTEDEDNLTWGARRLHRKLSRLRGKHVYQGLEDGRMNIEHPYDVSPPFLWRALEA